MFLGVLADADSVRNIFFLSQDEMGDEGILAKATRVEAKIVAKFPTFADPAVIAGLSDQQNAWLTDYTAYTTALLVLPSIKLWLEKSARDDSGAEGIRFEITQQELDVLEDDIRTYLGELESLLQEFLGEQQTSGATFVVMDKSTPTTDVVTGNAN